MTLLDEAKKVAAEFEYTAEDVNRGVKAFISQMGAYIEHGGSLQHCETILMGEKMRGCRRKAPP